MSVARNHNRLIQDLPELRPATNTRGRIMPVATDLHFGRENKENFPVLSSPSELQSASILRQYPRLPLQEINHLFRFNGDVTNIEMQNVRTIAGNRRRPLDNPFTPFSLKKRRTSEASSPMWQRFPRPSFKCTRSSTGLRSFR
ncbi:hypothetical protein R1sor_004103 [Riccia sorocarpa]|uniref:Uncharacterized protein n=1 Tax=Riccia sorocarpa TaxID=122646 RepID=A0ABD3H7I9_9MARC